MPELPQAFLSRMESFLGREYGRFTEALTGEKTLGLRVNTLKVSAAAFSDLVDWELTPVPWCPAGYYYAAGAEPGKHPWHNAGLYYLQDASAMAVAQLAAPEAGERVLDLCAAPGGKATHLAALMEDKGLLVANEVQPRRAAVLAENLERWGVKSALVTAAEPSELATRFGPYFDCIVVDAPCSGEGMFRKDAEARRQWSPNLVEKMAALQRQILKAAYAMLLPGGRLVYSTCTFSREENEDNIAWFLNEYRDLALQSALVHPLWSPGFSKGPDDPMRQTARLWPHLLQGEGHFVALLLKQGEERQRPSLGQRAVCARPDALLTEFAEAAGVPIPEGPFLSFGAHVYQVGDLPNLADLRVLRPGWHLGELRKGRFIPGHAWALALRPGEIERSWELGVDTPQVAAYLAGHTLPAETEAGWLPVTSGGFALGWGKVSGGILKNHYPKGLRRL